MENWLSNIFGGSKGKLEAYQKEVTALKEKVRKLIEVNKSLENQVETKSQDLNKANRTVSTIIQIWKNIKSSESLSSVLSVIVNGLTKDLSYLYSVLFQIYQEKEGALLKIRVASEVRYFNIEEILGNNFTNLTIPYSCTDNPLVQAIKSQELQRISSFCEIFIGSNVKLEKSQLDRLESIFIDRAITVLPLMVHGKPFGCLMAVSLKKDINEVEKNYLKLFAGQTELSVSMTGLLEQVKEQAITDPLTGLFNRRHFDERLSNEIKKALRTKRPFTIVSLDLDHLKQINDNYGHSAGDAAISTIGKVLLSNVREIDIPARFGGEEFAVIMPEVDSDGGVIAAERIRAVIASRYVEGIGNITASIGVATFLKHASTQGELLELVDQAMYRAKKNGRNRVEVAGGYEEFDWIQFGLEMFMDILGNVNLPIDRIVADDLIHKIQAEIPESDEWAKILFDNLYLLLKNYDPFYLAGIIRVKTDLAGQIAEKKGMAKYEVDKIKLATILCDIGNIMIPKEILLKDENILDDDERRRLHEHSSLTAKEILKPIKSTVINSILSVIVHHHENWDGTGYPYKLTGEEIPIGSRIIGLVNGYVDLISKKSHRKAYYPEEAVDIIRKEASIKWDPGLAHILVEVLKVNR